jgi:hypothetical protein
MAGQLGSLTAWMAELERHLGKDSSTVQPPVTQGMPTVLRDTANRNPMSAIAAACRDLFGGINPSATVAARPMRHPELAVLAWSAGLIAIFAPLAVILSKRKVLR